MNLKMPKSMLGVIKNSNLENFGAIVNVPYSKLAENPVSKYLFKQFVEALQ